MQINLEDLLLQMVMKNINGGDTVAQVLNKNGVTHVFTLCGGHITPILLGCKAYDIRVIDMRSEANAAFAADAYARLTGYPGVCVVTAGPGVTNTVTAVRNAKLAESPLIILAGATATILRGRGSLQDIDQIELVRSNVKYVVRITSVDKIIHSLNLAIEKAICDTPGPVFVELPIDILYPEDIVRNLYGVKPPNELHSLSEKVFNWYLNKRLQRIFSKSNIDASIVVRKYKKVGNIKKIVDELKSSERPVLVLGSQIVHDVSLVPSLVKAIEILHIPVFLSGMARGLLGKDHELHIRHGRKKALNTSDLVILCGSIMDFRLDYGRHIGRSSKVISVNLDKSLLSLNTMIKRVRYKLHGSPTEFLIRLSKMYQMEGDEWIKELRLQNDQRTKEINEMAMEVPEKFVNPLSAISIIEKHIDDDAIIIGDGGDFLGTASYVIQPRKPLSWLDPGVFGTLGTGAGFAIASKLVRPECEIWLIYGDGSAGYSIIEFDTMVRHGIPIIAIIGNDASWQQIAREQIKMFGDPLGTVLNHTRYDQVVESLGGTGILVRNIAELEAAIPKAKSLVREGIPVLINILLTQSNFREGSISV